MNVELVLHGKMMDYAMMLEREYEHNLNIEHSLKNKPTDEPMRLRRN